MMNEKLTKERGETSISKCVCYPVWKCVFTFGWKLSYVVKVDKYMLVLSTLRYMQATEALNKFKPTVISTYNENKSGVDTIDQMLSDYSATNRWPLTILYITLGVTDLASYIINNIFRLSKKSNQRRDSILELAEQLTTLFMERRAVKPMVYDRQVMWQCRKFCIILH